MIKNGGQGKIWYGLHFYSGLAQYDEPGKDSYKVFLNEDVLRKMDESFAGRPVFVQHVNEVKDKVDDLKHDADGWVIKSFYNSHDGKHWCEFITVTERAEKAIQSGMRLSNCYIPKSFGNAGIWNGIAYDREITSGTYEHLAIVEHPRYAESVIYTPEQFKRYNEDKINKLSNSKNKEVKKMSLFNFFAKKKVEDTADLETLSVVLPKSKREIEINKLINEADEREVQLNSKEPMVAHDDYYVTCDGHTMRVGDLRNKYEKMKAKKKKNETDDDDDLQNSDDDDADDDKKKKAKDKKKNEDDAAAAAQAKLDADAKAKADKIRNAGPNNKQEPLQPLSLSTDNIARGKLLYGTKIIKKG